MIKTIKSIKNFGVFSNFTKDKDIRTFNDKNIFYGWNYSGKTTLSRLFSFLDNDIVIDEEYSNVEFQIELNNGSIITQDNRNTSNVHVKVFNSDFVRKNLHFDSDDEKIEGIKFSVGDVGEIQDQIKDKDKYIEKAKSIISRNNQNIELYKKFDSEFTTLARSISENLSLGRSYNKSNVWNQIDDWNKNSQNYNEYIIQASDIDHVKLDATAQKTGTIIDINNPPQTQYLQLFESVKALLLREPSQNVENELLSSDKELYEWVQRGWNIYKQKTQIKKCAFCGNDISDGEALKNLNSFYSNEAAKVKDEIEKIKEDIEIEKRTFQELGWSKKSVNDLAKSQQTEYRKTQETYSKILSAYTALLDQLIAALENKYSHHLFESVNLKIDNSNGNGDMLEWIDSVRNIFTESNHVITNFEETQKKAKERYKLYQIAQYLIDKDFSEIDRKKNVEKKWKAKIDSAINRATNEKKELQAQLDSIDKGGKELEDFIKLFLSREDISIDTTEDNYFILKRNGQVAKHLSDGEKTAIAISHFFVGLKSLKDEKKLSDYVIFIDDPISSLDANHIAQVSSLINTFFFESGLDVEKPDKVCNCFKQLFISTHNFEFFSFIKDANNIKRKKKEELGDKKNDVPALNTYLIKKQTITQSIITNIPSSLINYKSEYVYLFSEIERFKTDGFPEDRMYIMPNIVRRFLEIYTLMKLPGNTDEIDNRIKLLFANDMKELKILHNFSHFTSFNRVTNHSELVLRMPDIINDVYVILGKDSTHFESLKQGIKK